MRIVHLYKDYFPPVRGGIEQTVHLLATSQANCGHEVVVLTSAHGARRTTVEVVDGVQVIRVAEWARWMSTPMCPSMPFHLARLGAADVWHLHFPSPPGEVSWWMVRPLGALVVTYHSDVVRQASVMSIYGPLVRALLGRADVILPTSENYIVFSALLGRYRHKCLVVPSGVDLERFQASPTVTARAAGLRACYGGPFVLFVGRLRYYKGIDVLLAAMPSVEGRLVIVGDGPEEGALRAQHAALGLGDRVRFAGAVSHEELIAHLAAADVGVLPSTYPSEAFGLSMVEMMASGLAVVCTELGTGTSFVNVEGETGLVVPPRDRDALAAALNRLLGDPALRGRLGAAGRKRARALFSREAMVRGVQAAYEDALARRRRSG